MIRLSVPKVYSKYFDDDTFAHHVTVFINDTAVTCSGVLLASQSEIFEDSVVRGNGEIILEEFAGCEQDVRKCLAALHGAGIHISFSNIQVVLKFSAFYRVNELFQHGLCWVRNEMATRNLAAIFSITDFLSDEYFMLLKNVLNQFIENNIDGTIDEMKRLLLGDKEVDVHLIIMIVKTSSSAKGGEFLCEWLIESPLNCKAFLMQKETTPFRKLFPHTSDFTNFINILSQHTEDLDGVKAIAEIQNMYFANKGESHPDVQPEINPSELSSGSDNSLSLKPKQNIPQLSRKHNRNVHPPFNTQDSYPMIGRVPQFSGPLLIPIPQFVPFPSGSSIENTCQYIVHGMINNNDAKNNRGTRTPSILHEKKNVDFIPADIVKLLSKTINPKNVDKNRFFGDIFIKSRVWREFDCIDFLMLPTSVLVDMYTYIEMSLDWSLIHRPAQEDFSEIWNTFQIFLVSFEFISIARSYFSSVLDDIKIRGLPLENSWKDHTETLSINMDKNLIKSLLDGQIIFIQCECNIQECHRKTPLICHVQLAEYPPLIVPEKHISIPSKKRGWHMHSEHILHWFCVVETPKHEPRLISLNLFSRQELKLQLRYVESCCLKCVISLDFVKPSGWGLSSVYHYHEKCAFLARPETISSLNTIELLKVKRYVGVLPYLYIDICLAWIKKHAPNEAVVKSIWNTFDVSEVSLDFLASVKEHLKVHLGYDSGEISLSDESIKTLNLPVTKEQIKDILDEDEHYLTFDVDIPGIIGSQTLTVEISDTSPILKLVDDGYTQIPDIEIQHWYGKLLSTEDKLIQLLSTTTCQKNEFFGCLLTHSSNMLSVDYKV